MNIFLQVTLKTLSRNKTRTLVTIIGIILSAAMLTAVTSFVTSLQEFMIDVGVYEEGDWHGCLYDVGPNKISELKDDPGILRVAACENIGYSALPNPKFGSSPYIFVIGADSNFNSMMPVHITKGRLPEDTDEIILPVHLLKNGGTEFSIGERITLDIGVRMYDNRILSQQYAFTANEDGTAREELVIRETRSFTIVGFYERPSFESFTSPGYTAITVMDGTVREGETFDVYFKLKKPAGIYDFMREEEQKEGYAGSSYNDDFMYIGVSKYSGFYTVLYSLSSILIILIMAGSVSLIYNAFSISVSERTKQIGLLSSVGATHKQIRKCILYEAMFVSAIGIPIGILSGLAGIGITLSIVGQRLATIYSGYAPYKLSLHVNIWTIVSAVLLAMVTVLISAWIPARRATRITAIEAIRQTKDINVKAKDVRTSKLTYRLFGLEGMLARKHFRRSRRRYRTTVVSLFMSIVLFISASSFCSYLKDSVTGVLGPRDYDISWVLNTQAYTEMTPRQVYEMLAQTEGLTDSVYAFVEFGSTIVDNEDIFDEFKKRYRSQAAGSEENGEEDSDVVELPVCVFIVPDEVFDGFASDEGINGADAVVMAYTEGIDTATNKYTKTKILRDTLSVLDLRMNLAYEGPFPEDLTEEELEALLFKDISIDVGAVVDSLPFAINGLNFGCNVTVMVPERCVPKYFADMEISKFVYYFFKGKDHAALADKLSAVLDEHGLPAGNLRDHADYEETNRNMIFIINVFAYGFIVLISLIAAANVFNTISTGINLRRREFAMLKSVGMTQKGFHKMMDYECLMYGTKSLLWGLPAAIGVTYLIYRSINSGYVTNFYIPWVSIIAAVFSVFAVVFTTMLYSTNKLKNENIIDALRNENL
ncbi:MAG TPA: ABC transporter permease [Clostridiales bacterium]|nr:ABC transporter permease [Clostridiales bacterium]HPP36201.1 ABC transporter permease [Clostridiales bacterium]